LSPQSVQAPHAKNKKSKCGVVSLIQLQNLSNAPRVGHSPSSVCVCHQYYPVPHECSLPLQQLARGVGPKSFIPGCNTFMSILSPPFIFFEVGRFLFTHAAPSSQESDSNIILDVNLYKTFDCQHFRLNHPELLSNTLTNNRGIQRIQPSPEMKNQNVELFPVYNSRIHFNAPHVGPYPSSSCLSHPFLTSIT
jgi:hypothetical protein